MDNIPHQAVITLQIKGEVCERLPTGQVGKPIKKTKRLSRLYTVVGSSIEECEQKANELLTKISEKLDASTEETQ